jgi:Uma2 family endonuclease
MEVIIDRELPRGSKLIFPEEMSEEAFDEFCMQNPDLFLERDKHGNIVVEPPVSFDTGGYELEASGQLYIWNRKHRAGKVFSPSTGFTLPNGAVRSPDLSWISAERVAQLPKGERKKFARICPDFVMEIRSCSDRLPHLQEKMQEYIENGAQLGFLIDPIEQQAFIYRPDTSVAHIAGLEGSLSGEPVLPGFFLPLSLFAGD